MEMLQRARQTWSRKRRHRKLAAAIKEHPEFVFGIAEVEDAAYVWKRVLNEDRYYIGKAVAAFLSRRAQPKSRDAGLYADYIGQAIAGLDNFTDAEIANARIDLTGPYTPPFWPFKNSENLERRIFAIAYREASRIWVAEWVERFVLADVLNRMGIAPRRKGLRNGEILLLMLKHLEGSLHGPYIDALSRDLVTILEQRVAVLLPGKSFSMFNPNRAKGQFVLNELLDTVWQNTEWLRKADTPVKPDAFAVSTAWLSLGDRLRREHWDVFGNW